MLTLTSPVVPFSFATRFLSNATLLRVVNHLLAGLAALRRRREELGEGVDEALGLAVVAQAALLVVASHGEEQPVVARVPLTGGAGGGVRRDRPLPAAAPPKLLEGPPRPVGDRSENPELLQRYEAASLQQFIRTRM